jgi:hypothetical protein
MPAGNKAGLSGRTDCQGGVRSVPSVNIVAKSVPRGGGESVLLRVRLVVS